MRWMMKSECGGVESYYCYYEEDARMELVGFDGVMTGGSEFSEFLRGAKEGGLEVLVGSRGYRVPTAGVILKQGYSMYSTASRLNRDSAVCVLDWRLAWLAY